MEIQNTRVILSMSAPCAPKPLLVAVLAFFLSLTGSATDAVAQDRCEILPEGTLATTPVLNQICPPGIASVDDLFFRPGAGGQENRDLRILAAILARATETPQGLSSAEAERLSDILNENATIRVGLQIVILSNLFDNQELDDWCRWRRRAETSGFSLPTDNALEVEEVLQCFDVLQ